MLLGASGFLGSALQKVLATDSSMEVLLVSRHPESLNLSGATVIHIDDVFVNLPAVDWVVNCAVDYGRSSSLDAFVANIEWPLSITRRARDSGTSFLNLGTFYEKFPLSTYSPLRVYSLTKSLIEAVGPEVYMDSDSSQFFSLRIEHLYGPGDGLEKFVPWLFHEMKSGVPEIRLTSCLQKRDFIFVEDAARMIHLFLTDFKSIDKSRPLEIGTAKSTALIDFVKLASVISGYKGNLGFGVLDTPMGDIRESCANPYLGECLGLTFESLESGLSRTWSAIQQT